MRAVAGVIHPHQQSRKQLLDSFLPYGQRRADPQVPFLSAPATAADSSVRSLRTAS
jgi:hypothetical protein